LIEDAFVLSRDVRLALLATTLAAAVLPAVPDSLSLPAVVFVCCYVWLCLACVRLQIRLRDPPSPAGLPLTLFFLSALASLLIASGNGVTFSEWVRAIIPFAFLGAYYLFPSRLSQQDAQFALASIHFSANAWLVTSLVPVIPALRGGGIERLTHLGFQFLLPYGLVGLVTSLFMAWPRYYRIACSFLFTFVIVATAYRSQFLIAAILWLVYLSRSRYKLLWATALVLAGVFAFQFLHGSVFLDAFVQRFTNLEEAASSPRAKEIAYAVSNFLRSPIVGNGLGFRVPVSVNEFEPVTGALWVPYMHNVWAYLLMDLGIVGFLGYVGFFAGAAYVGWSRYRVESPGFTALLLMAALLLYFTVEAAFRQIQSNLVLAILAVVLTKSLPEKRRDRLLEPRCAPS